MMLSRILLLSFLCVGMTLSGHAQLFAPVANNDNSSTSEDSGGVTFNITDNDTDADLLGAINAASVDLNPSTAGDQKTVTDGQGTFTVDNAGNVTYTPALNFNGDASITYVIHDNILGIILSNEATITVTVSAVNDAPVIDGQDLLSTNEEQDIILTFDDLDVTDVDSPGYPIGFSLIIGSGSNYSFSGNTITPATNFAGTLTIPVQVSDGSATSTPTFNLSITVNNIADPPLITGQNALSTNEDQALLLSLNNLLVTDPDLPAYPSGFTMTVDAGTNYTVNGLTITPAANFSGPLTVPVQVSDGTFTSNTINLSVTVTAVNDPPVINTQNAVSTNEDQAVLLTPGNLNVTDIDNPGYPTGFTMSILAAGANYTFSGLTVTPTANYSGPLTVPVQVNDGSANSNTFNLSITVNAVNDAPVIGSQDPLSTPENTPITLSLNDINVTDIDTPGYPAGFTMSVAGTGANFTSSGLVITPAANYSGPITVPVQVNDGALNSNTFNLVITVNDVNSPPVINTQNPVSTNEDQAVLLNLNNLNVTDVDNPGYPTGFTMSILAAGANYTFSGLTVTPATNYSGPLTVPVQVNDGSANSNTFNLSITVNAVNDAPVITAQVPLSVNEDESITVLLANVTVTDVDNTPPAGFTLTVQGGNDYTFSGNTVTPTPDFSGTLIVPVIVSDGTTNSLPFNLTITVNDANDLPAAVNDVASTSEDTPVSFSVVTNDSDSDGTIAANTVDLNTGSVGIQGSVTTPQGTFSVNSSGLVTYTPLANFFGTAQAQYTVNDNSGGTSNIATITVTVNNVNDPPVINSQDPLVTQEEQNIVIGFTDLNVTDSDNTYPTGFSILVSAGSNYTILSGTTIVPAANFSGTLTVPVQVNDGAASSAIFNVSITVNPINDAPVIASQATLTTPEDQAITLTLNNLTVTDPDDTYPTGFTMTVNAGTNYTFSGLTITPAANFSGTLTVPVFVNDGVSNSNTFNLSIAVTAVNDAPVITGQNALSVNEDQSLALALGNLVVTDVDNTYPTGFTLTVLAGTNYTFTGTTITPTANFAGTLTVPVRVSDGTANSNTFNLSVTVTGVNDPPVINSQTAISTNEDQPVTILFTHLSVTDADNTYPTGFTLSVSGGTNYSVAGTTVTPAANFSGVLTVPVAVNDGTSNSNTFNLSITVNSANDAPAITGQNTLTVNEDQSITIALGDLIVTDVDNNYPTGFALTVLAGSNYSFTGTTVTPSANFAGILTVPVRVSDGTANSNTFNLSITVSPSNDAPVITGQTVLSVNEDTPITLQLSNLIVTDPDNSYPTGFTLTVLAGSNYTASGSIITPAANFSGVLTVPVRVSDGTTNSNTFNLSITVVGGNDAPVITGQSVLSVNEDNSIVIQLANLVVTDPDDTYPTGFTLTVLGGTNYSLSGNTVTPAANFSGNLSVPVRVNDGSTDSAPFNLTIAVNPVNDAPVITGQQPLTTGEEQALTILLSNLLVTDPDNTYPTGFTLTVLTGTNYTVTGNTITPASNFTGTLTVPVRVTDGTTNSNTLNLSVTVTPVDDAPVITGQIPLSMNEDTNFTIQLAHLTVTDPDNTYPAGFTLTVSPGTNYTVSGNTITPATNFTGALSIPVTVNDGITNSAIFNLSVTVNAVNDIPQITGQTPLNTGESQPIPITLSQLFVLDPDDAYPADFSLFVLSGSNYSVVGNVVTPVANFSGLLKVQVFVNDGAVSSAIYDLQILVNSVNDPPVITSQQPLSVNEDNAITVQFANLNVSDPDNSYPTGFSLTVIPGTNYTFSGNTVTPVLNFTGLLTVSVKVNDGLSDSAPFGLQITVNPVNDAPQITGQQPLSTHEDQPIAVQFSNLVVVDPDNTYPTGFTLTILDGSNYTFSGTTITPAANFSGTLTVPVRVNDGAANSNNFNLQISVDAINDAPVIVSQATLTTPEDTPIVIKFADLTISDPDDTYPTGFTLTVASGTNYTVSGATVTPALNFNGTLSVNVTVNDGAANSAVFPLQVLVNPVNTPPTITGQVALNVNEDTPITLQLSNLIVTDPDNAYPTGFTLIVAAGANYSFAGNTITPAANFNGNLTIPVRVNDGINNSAPFNLLLKVNPVNDPPAITNQTVLTINEDQFILLQLSNFTVADPDNTFPTGFTLNVAEGPNYTVSGTRVTPVANFSGNLTVNVTINDGTDNSTVFPLVVKVNPVNDPPRTNGLPPSTIEEDNTNEIIINLLNGFSDTEDASNLLAYQIMTNDNPSFFQSIAINQALGELRYKVKPNVFGVAKVTIRATDTGALTVQDVLTITINGVNDAPSVDAVPNQQVIENSAPQTITLTNVTKGPFENIQTLNLFATSGNTTIIPNPVITYDGNSSQAQLKYTVQPNKSGVVTITLFAIDDGSNTLPNRNSFSATFDIEVVEINNAPTLDAIAAASIQEDAAPLSIPLTGISAGAGETQTLTITATHSKPEILDPVEIIYTSPQNTGTLKLKPKADANGSVQVTVTVTDSGPNSPAPNVNTISRQFNLTISPVNDLPEFKSTPVLTATVGEVYRYEIAVTDVDNTTITLTAAQKPAWASLTVQNGGKEAVLTGTPPPSAKGSSVVRLQAKDPTGAPVNQEYTLVVNTLPQIDPFEVTTPEDIGLVLQQQKFTAAFSDDDGNAIDKIMITDLANPKLGKLLFNGNEVSVGSEIPFSSLGSLVYQPAPDTTGIDTIRYNASDGLRYAVADARIRIIITPANDAPRIDTLETEPLEHVIGEGPQIMTLKFKASDPDYDSLISAEIGFRITNYELDKDVLMFTNTENIQGAFNAQSGTLSLTGKASATEYSQAIRSIQYQYKSQSLPANISKIIYFTLSDGQLLSETRDRYIELVYTFEELQIANGFTPNNDTFNDTWIPVDTLIAEGFRDAELKVYDKRGKLLFETTGFKEEWDGTFQGEQLPADSYFFTIDLKLPFIEKTYKGIVTILR